MPKYPCRIVIVGGSVAGLSLANMLEQVGIDFIILEAGKEIAPQFANRFADHDSIKKPCILTCDPGEVAPDRIYELGIGDALLGLVENTVNHTIYRNQQGDAIFEFRGLADGLERRHGYPIIFLERQMLLQKLYEKLQHKDKVHMQKRCVEVEQDQNGVRVKTEDGCTYSGDILIGADGIHSTVRRHMHRLAHASSPGYFDMDEYAKVPCVYKCIFGMSPESKGIRLGTHQVVMGKGHSYIFFTGPSMVYWFLNVKNPQATYGKRIPRYTVEDEHLLAAQHFGDRLNEHDTFGDIYKSRVISRLTPLHEYQWKRWSFGRIMTIGDAAHKLHPISGNGGGAAVEDAAVLVNSLQRRLRRSERQPLSTRDFQVIFAEAQHAQERRTKQLLDAGSALQRFDALESVFAPLIVKHVVPNLTDDAVLSVIGINTGSGQRVKSLPVPQRDRYVPYVDELPARPLPTAHTVNACFALVHLLLLFLAFSPRSTARALVGPVHIVLNEENGSSQSLSSVVLLIPTALIWTLEGHRRGNKGSLYSWPLTFLVTLALAVAGPAKVVPAYFIGLTVNSSRPAYAAVVGRPVPVLVASAMITVTCAAYAAGLALAFFTQPAPGLAEPQVVEGNGAALWRLLPSCIPAALQLRLLFSSRPPAAAEPSLEELRKEYMAVYFNRDYPPLTRWYRMLLVLAVQSSIYFRVLAGQPYYQKHLGPATVAASIVAHCLQSTFQLRGLGYATNREVAGAVLGIVVCTSLLDPTVAYVGFWYWREHAIQRLSR